VDACYARCWDKSSYVTELETYDVSLRHVGNIDQLRLVLGTEVVEVWKEEEGGNIASNENLYQDHQRGRVAPSQWRPTCYHLYLPNTSAFSTLTWKSFMERLQHVDVDRDGISSNQKESQANGIMRRFRSYL